MEEGSVPVSFAAQAILSLHTDLCEIASQFWPKIKGHGGYKSMRRGTMVREP